MILKYYIHDASAYALKPGEPVQRLVIALLDDKRKFVDSFDYRIETNEIRFYGSERHYRFDKVPAYKKKLWNIKDFSKLVFFEVNID